MEFMAVVILEKNIIKEMMWRSERGVKLMEGHHRGGRRSLDDMDDKILLTDC